MKSLLVFTIIILGQALAMGSIPNSSQSLVVVEPPMPTGEKEVFSKENINKYLPTDLSPTTDQVALGTQLETKMGQRIFQGFLDGDTFKKSKLGRVTESVKEAAAKSVSVGSPTTGVVHTFKVQVQAIERFARLDYTGFFDSNLIYAATDNSAKFTVTKPVSKTTSISFVESTPEGSFVLNPNLTLSLVF